MVHGGRDFDGEKLRAARTRLRWSQHELARRSGVAQPNISLFERGRSQPEPPTLRALTQALGVAPRDLLVPAEGTPSLARRRMEAGLIQRHLADELGIPPSTYAAIERGEVEPSPEVARRLDKLLTEPAARPRRRR